MENWQKILVFLLFFGAIASFVSNLLRPDVIALCILGTLGISGVVDENVVMRGFSSQSVVTMWAMFILSASLAQNGASEILTQYLERLFRRSEKSALWVTSLLSAGISSFMTNISAAVFLMPALSRAGRLAGISQSRLLMPMAYSVILGGKILMIGSIGNLIASDVLLNYNFTGFGIFDFLPLGVLLALIGAFYSISIGRKLLPSSPISKETRVDDFERWRGSDFFMQVFDIKQIGKEKNADSVRLAGKSLGDLALNSIVGLNVSAIETRDEIGKRKIIEEPSDAYELREKDILHANGNLRDLELFTAWQAMEMARGDDALRTLNTGRFKILRAELSPKASIIALKGLEADLRGRFQAFPIGVDLRGDKIIIGEQFRKHIFNAGDAILFLVKKDEIDRWKNDENFSAISTIDNSEIRNLLDEDTLLLHLRAPELMLEKANKIADSPLFRELHFRPVALIRQKDKDKNLVNFPNQKESLLGGDIILAFGNRKNLAKLKIINALKFTKNLAERDVTKNHEQNQAHHVEIIPSPQCTHIGQSFSEIGFRRNYEAKIVKIKRGKHSYEENQGKMRLKEGDAIELRAKRQSVIDLSRNQEFILLNSSIAPEVYSKFHPSRFKYSIFIMLLVIVIAMIGASKIHIAAVLGVALMIISRCISPQKAYRSIDWSTVFLMASLLPLGVAMRKTGAAALIASRLEDFLLPLGDFAVIFVIYAIASFGSAIMPVTALLLLLCPIAIEIASFLEASPLSMVMICSVAAQGAFFTPKAFPVNVLITGQGSYSLKDFYKFSLPLSVIHAVVALPALHFLWPLRGENIIEKIGAFF